MAQHETYADHGTAARFFYAADWSLDVAERLADADPVRYVAKASRRERNAGCEGLPERAKRDTYGDGLNSATKCDPRAGHTPESVAARPLTRNHHPTVKPLALARYLATLLLPPDAYAPRRILVPFAGSGSEALGAMLAGWEDVTAVEREAEYVEIAKRRAEWWEANRDKAPEVRAMGRSEASTARGLSVDPHVRIRGGNFGGGSGDRFRAKRNGHDAPHTDEVGTPPLPGLEEVG